MISSLVHYQETLVENINKKTSMVGFISVYVGGKGYLLHLENIAQIGKFQKFSRLGLEKDWFEGIASLDNDILPVINLGNFLEVLSDKTDEMFKVNDLVRLRDGERKSNWALGVERIGALISYSELTPLTEEEKGCFLKEFLLNKSEKHEPEILSELDLNILLQNEELKTVFGK